MRTKNIKLNFITSALPLIIIMIIGIFKSKIFLDYLGTNTVGLYQLYSQLIGYLTLFESGMTSALLYRLFKPVKEKDENKINILIQSSRIIFKIIGLIMLVIGIIFSFFIPLLIKNNPFTLSYIMITFILYILTNIIFYFVVSYKILLDVQGKKHINNLIIQIALIIQSILEIIFVLIGFKLISILIIGVVINIISSLIIVLYCLKQNKYLNKNINKDFSMVSDVKNIFFQKIANLISNNIDLLLISSVKGLYQVVIYSTYNYICNSLKKLINYIYISVIPSAGDLYIESKNKFKNFIYEFNDFVFYIGSIIVIPLFIVINNFIIIWYKNKIEVNEITALLFSIILYYAIIRQPLQTTVEVTGIFKETKKCALIEVIINLVLSVILVTKYEVVGVLLATLISLIISEYMLKPGIIFKHIFKTKSKKYYKDTLLLIIIFVLELSIEYIVFKNIVVTNIISWLCISIFIFIINFLITSLIYHILKRDSFMARIKR